MSWPQVKEQQREANQPKQCAVPGCEEKEREHIKDGEYRTLRHHYALAHWRRWFERAPGAGEGPRTQRLTKTGAHCQVGIWSHHFVLFSSFFVRSAI